MKKMLKLNELNKKEMIMVRGGTIPCGSGSYCGCGCQNAGNGGSSQSNNSGANAGNGYASSNSIPSTYSLKTVNVTG